MKIQDRSKKFLSASRPAHRNIEDYKKKHLDMNTDDSGDEGSGGNSKGKLHSYKLEGLKDVLNNGPYKGKADKFGNFLSREGLDASELKKTELDKQAEDKGEHTVIEEKGKKTEKDSKNARQLTEANSKQGQVRKNWGQKAGKESSHYGFLSEHADNIGRGMHGNDTIAASIRASEYSAGSSDMQGSINNQNLHGNSQGFTQQGGELGASSENNVKSKSAKKYASVFGDAGKKNSTGKTKITEAQELKRKTNSISR